LVINAIVENALRGKERIAAVQIYICAPAGHVRSEVYESGFCRLDFAQIVNQSTFDCIHVGLQCKSECRGAKAKIVILI